MRIVAVFFVSLLVLASCGPSITQVCQDHATAWCNQQYKCATGTALTNLQTQYGQTAAACATSYGSQCATAQSPCALGTSYDSGQAEKCVQAYAALTDCTKVLDPQLALPDCATSSICH